MSVDRAAIILVGCAFAIACGQGEEAGVAAAAAPAALSSDCTGLVPDSVPAGFSTVVELGDECSAMGATTDGVGNAAIGKTCPGGFESWPLVNPGRQSAGQIYLMTNWDPAEERQERHLFPQRGGGFLGFHWSNEYSTPNRRVVALLTFDGNGTRMDEHFLINLSGTPPPDHSWSIAPVRTGGVQITHVSVPGDSSWHLYTQRYTPAGTAAGGVQQLATAINSSVPQQTLTGVAIGGQALIAWDNGTEGRAVWTDASGHLAGGTFSLPFRVNQGTSVAPLLDGTIAFNVNGTWSGTGDWAGVIAPGSHTVAAAPSWLSTRPGSRLFMARGGRAHALFTQPPAGSCRAHVVLFAPAGNRCGAVDLRSADANGCATAGEVGQDGSVTVEGEMQLYDTGEGPQQRVTQRFYPQLLK